MKMIQSSVAFLVLMVSLGVSEGTTVVDFNSLGPVEEEPLSESEVQSEQQSEQKLEQQPAQQSEQTETGTEIQPEIMPEPQVAPAPVLSPVLESQPEPQTELQSETQSEMQESAQPTLKAEKEQELATEAEVDSEKRPGMYGEGPLPSLEDVQSYFYHEPHFEIKKGLMWEGEKYTFHYRLAEALSEREATLQDSFRSAQRYRRLRRIFAVGSLLSLGVLPSSIAPVGILGGMGGSVFFLSKGLKKEREVTAGYTKLLEERYKIPQVNFIGLIPASTEQNPSRKKVENLLAYKHNRLHFNAGLGKIELQGKQYKTRYELDQSHFEEFSDELKERYKKVCNLWMQSKIGYGVWTAGVAGMLVDGFRNGDMGDYHGGYLGVAMVGMAWTYISVLRLEKHDREFLRKYNKELREMLELTEDDFIRNAP